MSLAKTLKQGSKSIQIWHRCQLVVPSERLC